jgi:hypothetical protein
MALNPIPIGDAIAEYLYQNSIVAPGTPVSLAQIKTIWENVMTLIYNDIKDNMDVVPTAHSGPNLNNPAGQPLQVPALGIIDSTDHPCTGESTTGTTSALQDIQGKGSVL